MPQPAPIAVPQPAPIAVPLPIPMPALAQRPIPITVPQPVQIAVPLPVDAQGSPFDFGAKTDSMFCNVCAVHYGQKARSKRLPSCPKCHHFSASRCHVVSDDGTCLMPKCEASESCPSSHTDAHNKDEAAKVRELKRDHRFKSNTLAVLTKDQSKVQTSTALNEIMSILVAKKDEEDAGKRQAKEWADNLEWKGKPAKKRKIDEVDAPTVQQVPAVQPVAVQPVDPYNFRTEAEIREKIEVAAREEEDARRRRETLEFMLLRFNRPPSCSNTTTNTSHQ